VALMNSYTHIFVTSSSFESAPEDADEYLGSMGFNKGGGVSGGTGRGDVICVGGVLYKGTSPADFLEMRMINCW